jgi:methylenetetrahydrofolate dehydrogenase (NADP+)/methenyltetrahydrofolate cyclohydrolase
MTIDGAALARGVIAGVAVDVARLREERGIVPGLAVVLVGDDPASAIYVRSKDRRAREAGIASATHFVPAATSEDELLALLALLNADPAVHAVLVQLPLPTHIRVERVLRAVDPRKDVDGFHPENVGALAIGKPALVPATAVGCLALARTVRPSLRGLDAVVIGRSTIVGRPVAQLLLIENCTVTVAHSATRNLPAVARHADVLVVAVGRANMVDASWIKPGATVIDVGINRIAADGAQRIAGDVDFASVSTVAGAITPVPGGVGPMTIASLLQNVLRCVALQSA